MKYFILIIVAISSFAQKGASQDFVRDPIADFARYAHDPATKILKLEVELNGHKVLFLSSTNHYIGHGFAWTAYIASGAKYAKVDASDLGYPIAFLPDRYFIGRLPNGNGGEMLLTYTHGGGGKGTLSGYQIVDNKYTR